MYSLIYTPPQAACEIASKLKDLVINIDECDTDNELAVVEYIEDLYNFYKDAQVIVSPDFFTLTICFMTRNC